MTRCLWSGGCTSGIAHKTFLDPLYISLHGAGGVLREEPVPGTSSKDNQLFLVDMIRQH